MERMIDADLIYNAVEFRYKFSTGNEHEWERALLDLICDKTVEIVPLVHSRWVYNEGDYVPYCENCLMPSDTETKYCSSCGAIMDGKEDK